METLPLTMYGRFTSNQGIQEEEEKLKTQMQGLDPDSPEYEYDQLQLQREQIELQIREENPNLDPQTLAGNKALAQLMAQDPNYQAIEQKIKDLVRAYPSESTGWGIPMADSQYVKIRSFSN